MHPYEKPELVLTVFTPVDLLLASGTGHPETPIIPIKPKSGTKSGAVSPF